MCTVSWRGRPGGGYDLLFNRDESRKRTRAVPPETHTAPGGTRFLAATDPDAGGTWLAANSHGLAVGLLNFYDARPPHEPDKATSRGLLVRSLAAARHPGEVDVPDPTTYRPFHLFALAPDTTAVLLTWDGVTLSRSDAPELPLTTCSYRTAEVLAYRRDQFATTPTLEAFHRHHNPALPRHSPLMVRPDAITHSISHLTLTLDTLTYRYYDPPSATHPHRTQLPRTRAPKS